MLLPDLKSLAWAWEPRIAVGAVTGLSVAIVIGLTTDLPVAPEVGLVLGALAGWLARRDRA